MVQLPTRDTASDAAKAYAGLRGNPKSKCGLTDGARRPRVPLLVSTRRAAGWMEAELASANGRAGGGHASAKAQGRIHRSARQRWNNRNARRRPTRRARAKGPRSGLRGPDLVAEFARIPGPGGSLATAATAPGPLLLLLAGFGHREQLTAGAARAAAQLARLAAGGVLGRLFGRRFLAAFHVRLVQPFAAQADLTVRRIDPQHLHLDLVADLDDLLGTLHLVIGKLRDVEQAFQARLQLDENAEVGQLGDLALLDFTGVIVAGDVAFPPVV